MKQYQKEHEEELKEYQTQYRKEPEDERKQYQRNNKEKSKEYQKNYWKRILLKKFESDTGFEVICVSCN